MSIVGPTLSALLHLSTLRLLPVAAVESIARSPRQWNHGVRSAAGLGKILMLVVIVMEIAPLRRN